MYKYINYIYNSTFQTDTLIFNVIKIFHSIAHLKWFMKFKTLVKSIVLSRNEIFWKMPSLQIQFLGYLFTKMPNLPIGVDWNAICKEWGQMHDMCN